MDAYEPVYRALGFSRALTDCALGRIPNPTNIWRAPAGWYGFPPALIPVWSNGSGPAYLGAWKHWFTDRPVSFVEMFIDGVGWAVEVARTEEQFLSVMAIRGISYRNGLTERVASFAEQVGLRNVEELDSMLLRHGDSAECFGEADCFREMTPRETAQPATYDGDFGTPFGGAGRSCGFEREPSGPVRSPSADAHGAFNDCLRRRDLLGAWLCLNEPGWQVTAARKAVAQLASAADNPDFSLLAEAWLTVADPGVGTY